MTNGKCAANGTLLNTGGTAGIATSGDVVIPLPAKGVYIIIHNGQTVKTVN